MPKDNKIELQAFDFYKRIYDIHMHPAASLENIENKYIHMKDILDQVCHELTFHSQITFANLFARLDYVCKDRGVSPSDSYAIQTMRRNCHSVLNNDRCTDIKEYLMDVRALARFISSCYNEDIPDYLMHELPTRNRPFRETRQKSIDYIRASVTGWTDSLIYANTDMEDNHSIVIDYAKGGYDGDMEYLKDILSINTQINLLHVKVDEDNRYIPRMIVLNPDFLIDISTLSSCFAEYGHHPYNYFLNRLKPRANTHYILMGNLAGKFLDEYINETPQHPVSYASSIKEFFAQSALEFCTCSIPSDFHARAQAQMQNIRSFVNEKMPHDIPYFSKDQTLLEASFICESLGLQGRVDMMQKDFRILVEQKSGKRDEYRNCSREAHYIQMMLYQEILMYNFHLKAKDVNAFLLYSKYANGLVLEKSNSTLFRETMKLRNYIVATEWLCGEGHAEYILDHISTDILNTKGRSDRLWRDYQEPELSGIINVLKNASPLEREYFVRFYTFVMKELSLAKTGGGSDSARGFASLWHTSITEKKEAGNILTGLRITSKERSSAGKGYDMIELSIPQQKDDFIPNFRKGDMIILYSYEEMPDVRHSILTKGNIVEIRTERIRVQLRNGQQNSDLIGTADDIFAIEHDASDMSATGGIKALYTLLNANKERKDLLLGIRKPETDRSVRLKGDYGRFDSVILKAMQARDYFLLVGPPGTGKTSCALRYMVEEAMKDEDTQVLLMSYTNRAVDEICNMLVSSGIAEEHPFIRIGNELSCDKRFAPYLMDRCMGEDMKLDQIRSKLMGTRIFVATTTSINSRSYLFNIKHFHLAIIDEASQILEPDLIGLLAARQGKSNAIDKFILIGDYKQLPAISQQNDEDAMVKSKLLIDIGITDCRNSMFERLYRRTPLYCRDILNKQGRMHPAISEFPNNAFYYHENLQPVPLPHQEEELPYMQNVPDTDKIYRLLRKRRMVFIPAIPAQNAGASDKANAEEAKVVAALLCHIYSIAGPEFDADKTVGVIVPYRNQIAMVRGEIQKLGIDELMNISIDTVERYQGSQRDVIIYSFTVHNFHQLNFLSMNTFSEDEFIIDRKLNVAITRARKQLIMTGNPYILGANLTFYKLMEYIRMCHGYIDTTWEKFCNGDFEIPGDKIAEGMVEKYQLTDNFRTAFAEVIEKQMGNCHAAAEQEVAGSRHGYTMARTMEMTAYGRWDHSTTPEGISSSEVTAIYNYHFMPVQYASALSLFAERGCWMREAIQNASGRVVWVDLSYESGASAMAFHDSYKAIRPLCSTYILIARNSAVEATIHAISATPGYKDMNMAVFGGMDDIPSSFWHSHSVLPEMVIFNMSNLFDRINHDEARHLALAINRIADTYRLNHYVLIYRDDAGERRNIHAYETFANCISSRMHTIGEHMPALGKLYYGKDGPQNYRTYVYDILSNR